MLCGSFNLFYSCNYKLESVGISLSLFISALSPSPTPLTARLSVSLSVFLSFSFYLILWSLLLSVFVHGQVKDKWILSSKRGKTWWWTKIVCRIKWQNLEREEKNINILTQLIGFTSLLHVCMIWREESTDCPLFHVIINLIKLSRQRGSVALSVYVCLCYMSLDIHSLMTPPPPSLSIPHEQQNNMNKIPIILCMSCATYYLKLKTKIRCAVAAAVAFFGIKWTLNNGIMVNISLQNYIRMGKKE